jgi:drug/metabolite transporter (DMT)-like permease
MFWLYLVLIANLFNAVVVLLDRHLVSDRAFGKSEVYAFYVGLLSIFAIILLPFGVVHVPDINIILLSVVIGLSYMTSIVYLYKALRISDASDVAPVLGAIVGLSTFIFSLFFIQEILPGHFYIAFLFLIGGTLLMSYFRFTKRSVLYVTISGVLMGFSLVFLKILFGLTSFGDAFFWSRMANVLAALLLLTVPAARLYIRKSFKRTKPHTVYLTFVNKVLAGLAAFLLMLAIKVGHVSVVNALNGLQFVFLFVVALIFAKRFPDYFDETIQKNHNIFFKIVATFLIIVGYAMLFV